MMRKPFLWIAVAIVVLTPRTAWADPIGLRTFDIAVSGVAHTGEAEFTLQVYPQFDGTIGEPLDLFTSLRITPADIGQTFLATAETAPNFAGAAALLINGVSNIVEIDYGPVGAVFLITGSSEAGMFTLPAGAVDFLGFTLTAVRLHIENFSTAPGEDGSPRLHLIGSLSVLGSGGFDTEPVPEPATFTLFTTGALGAAWLRRRRSRDRAADTRR